MVAVALVNLLSLVAFAWISHSDPGFVPISPGRRQWSELVKEAAGKVVCFKCQLVLPDKARHCDLCGRCVANFDHHCFYIDNCVGVKNVSRFVAFLLFFLCLLLAHSWKYMSVTIWHSNYDPDRDFAQLLFGINAQTSPIYQTVLYSLSVLLSLLNFFFATSLL